MHRRRFLQSASALGRWRCSSQRCSQTPPSTTPRLFASHGMKMLGPRSPPDSWRDNAGMPALDALTLRPILPDDAPAAAELSAQLGYPVSPSQLRARIEALAGTPDHIVLAAVLDGQLVGWIDAAIERHLQAPDVVNIGGLVVRDSARGCRVGQRLCLAVEDWARSRSIPTVRVRSQIKRADAHRFYLRDGYRQVKTSLVFEKSVL